MWSKVAKATKRLRSLRESESGCNGREKLVDTHLCTRVYIYIYCIYMYMYIYIYIYQIPSGQWLAVMDAFEYDILRHWTILG